MLGERNYNAKQYQLFHYGLYILHFSKLCPHQAMVVYDAFLKTHYHLNTIANPQNFVDYLLPPLNFLKSNWKSTDFHVVTDFWDWNVHCSVNRIITIAVMMNI